MLASLYVPLPDPATGVIEQFDRYYTLEDISVPALKERMLNKHEYLGGGNGLATTTRVLKQADVVLMLHLFKDRFSREIKQANWQYYEPRTEHGSSLSPCVYALVASDIGSPDWAYPYFMRTATIDLTGDSKQYVGDLYIGGTHPAANGGAWMAAILGFAGVHCGADGVVAIAPALPRQWSAIGFVLKLRGDTYRIRITAGSVEVQAQEDNKAAGHFHVGGQTVVCAPGGQLTLATAAAATATGAESEFGLSLESGNKRSARMSER
jgi:trehalose/maltose hydrolase-like predicted phosphorylase